MAERIIMPKQGLQMTEGTILSWLVSEGGEVKTGAPLFEMETDKLTITIDSLVSGTLLKIIAPEGTTVPITGLIAVVGEPGEDISGLLGEAAGTNEPAAPSIAAPKPVPTPPQSAPAARVLISPRAKTRAAELGIDYACVAGTAPGGMIVERDILTAKAATPTATPLAKKTAELGHIDLAGVTGSGARGKITRRDVERVARAGSGQKDIVPMNAMRRVIAERMTRSLRENAQAVHRIVVRMDEAVRVRAALQKSVGFTDIIAFSVVRALREVPAINAEWTDGGIWYKDFVNLGVAVALEAGLAVPVVKNADYLTLPELSTAIKELAEKARDNKLGPDDYTGGSFTVSNLGMYGLEEFVAIINPPESGILAVGKIEDTPIAVDGKVEIHPVVRLTLSYDHRVIDGAPAARFLARIKEYLENPYLML